MLQTKINEIPTKINEIPTISAIIHHKIADIIKTYTHNTVIDIGGTGRSNCFIRADRIDSANIINGIDATRLPYKDNSYDISISIATFEHIEPEKKSRLY